MEENNYNNQEPKIGVLGVLVISTLLSIIVAGIVNYATDWNDGAIMLVEFIAFIILFLIVSFICTPGK